MCAGTLSAEPQVSSNQKANEKFLVRHVRIIFWCVAVLFGFLQAWNNRHVMNSDGICYLDLSDAYLQGDGRCS